MGSIPLAANNLRIPQPADPLQQVGQVIGFRSMMANQQAQQQEQQLRAQAIQEGQIKLADTQAASAAMRDWDGKDINDLPSLYLKNGASAGAVIGLKNSLVDYNAKLSTQTKTDLENRATKHDNVAGAMNGIAALPADQQQPAFEKLKTDSDFLGNLDPAERAQFGSLQYQGPDWAKQMGNEHLAESQLAANAAKTQEAAKNANEGESTLWKEIPGTGQLVNVKTNETKSAGITVPMPDDLAKGLGIPEQSGKPVTPQLLKTYKEGLDQGNKVVNADGRQQLVDPAGNKIKDVGAAPAVVNFNLQNVGAGGAASSATAAAIANGTSRWSDFVTTRTPMAVKESLLAQIKAIKPDFNSGDFAVEQKMKENATSGQVGQQLLAIGTARQHMQVFSQLADALDNGNVQLLNKIGNTLGVQFGSDKATNLKIAAQAFGGEVGRAFDGAGVIGKEREDAAAAYSNYLSKGQFKGAIQTVDQLLAGKQKAAHEWFDKGVQAKPDFGAEGGGQQSGGQNGGGQSGAQGAPANLPAVVSGFTRIQASDGSIHDIPSNKLSVAKMRDPGLKVQ